MSHNSQTSTHPLRSETCPSWCRADHEHQGGEADRWHHSAVVELPLVELARARDRTDGEMAEVVVPLDVALEQQWGSPNIYVLIGVGAQQARTFCLSLESAERLIEAMRAALRMARGRS